MEGQITWNREVKNYLLYTIKLENGDSGKTYVVKGFKNEANWSHLQVGDRVGGLIWFDEKKKIISADSPVYPLD
jgi:hypothetical protein